MADITSIYGNPIKDAQARQDITAMTTATASDVGKALKAKTVSGGKVTEWEFGEAGGGLSDDVKQALLQIAANVIYIDDGGPDYYDDLYDALYAVTAISINVQSIMLTSIGSTQQLTATTTPAGGAVTWASSNTGIATVSSTGLVTSTGYGSCTITASSGSVSASCAVAVSQVTLTSISAVYQQSGTVYDTDTLNSLKSDLTVTATYSDSSTATVTEYTLSGTLTAGTSTITVSYGGKTTTFNVTVTAAPTLTSISAVYTQTKTIYNTDDLDKLESDLVVTAHMSDSTTQTVTDYVLSGTLTVGTSTITVTYSGKTTTFTVTVTAGLYPMTITASDSGVGFGSVDATKPTMTPPYVANTNKTRAYAFGENALGYEINPSKQYRISVTATEDTNVNMIIHEFNETAYEALQNVQAVPTGNKAASGWLSITPSTPYTYTPTPLINNEPPVCIWLVFKQADGGGWATLDGLFPITIEQL